MPQPQPEPSKSQPSRSIGQNYRAASTGGNDPGDMKGAPNMSSRAPFIGILLRVQRTTVTDLFTLSDSLMYADAETCSRKT